MNERGEKARDDFLSESQEIIEQLNRDLLAIAEHGRVDKGDPGRAEARLDPELVNDAFRAVHSLKGLAGLFGINRMMQLSHHLENLLDALRLGRVAMKAQVLDLLFEAVELYQQVITETGQNSPPEAQSPVIESFIARIEAVAQPGQKKPVLQNEPATDQPFGDFDLDAALLAVLTEYEEHRLKENIREGRQLYRILASFPLLSIDLELEQLKTCLKPVGEVITYVPGSGGGDPERIDLEVMLGSSQGVALVMQAVAGIPVEIVPVSRRGGARIGAQARDSLGPPSAAPRLAEGDPLAASGARALPPAPKSPQTDPGEGPDEVASAEAEAAEGAVYPEGTEFRQQVRTGPPHGLAGDEPPGPPGTMAAAPGGGDAPASLKSVAQTVRVDIRRLDHLMNIVGELALARTGIQAIQNELKRDREKAELARSLQDELRIFSRKLDELQAGILEVRMVPLGQVFDKLSRVVRKLSRDAGKEIRFVVSGADTELDKLIVEELSDPLMHVIRNSIDHGIERAGMRQGAGKPEAGTVAITAEQRGNHVVLEIEDDGAGIDGRALVNRAVVRGLLTEEQSHNLSLHEIYNLMFLPGLSTREVADEMSGRGVGMDVVKTNIARMSGIIDVASEPGQGTRLTITLPITLAIIQALVIRASGRTYAIPLNSVMESLMLDYDQITTIERREVISLRDQTVPLLRLDEIFHLRRPPGQPELKKGYVVVVALAQHRLGLLVDDLLGQQDIVIKSLGRALQGIPGIAGATELGGQQTALVLDVRALAEEALPRAVEAA